MISVYKSNFKNYSTIHRDSIVRYCLRPRNTIYKKSMMDQNVHDYFHPVVNNLEDLLTATPDKLFEIKVLFDALTQNEKEDAILAMDYQGLYNLFTKKKSLLRNNTGGLYNSDELSKVIDISTCPYCNENTTYSFWHKKENSTRRTFDWDHILPKEKYPFLAISFFNLVPACKVCNHLKLNQIINLSPHSNFNPDNTYNFQISGDSIKFISDSKSINLLLKMKRDPNGAAIKEVMDIIGIETRLDTQKELIKDILNKKRIYQSSYWASIEKLVLDNNPGTNIDLTELFFSTYFNPDDYFRRPFSKLTHDLLLNKA